LCLLPSPWERIIISFLSRRVRVGEVGRALARMKGRGLYRDHKICYIFREHTMNIALIATQLIVILFAITIHEAAHGWAANKLGDPTAMIMGRVTLNPAAHIDPIGTVLLPLLMVGILFKIIIAFRPQALYFLNSVLRGGGFPPGFYPLEILSLILFYGVFLNVFLAVFNLIPIPPLDGSGILIGLISDEAAQKVERLRPFGFIIVIGMLWLGILDIILRPIWYILEILLF
jgi:Zn-dependent protease